MRHPQVPRLCQNAAHFFWALFESSQNIWISHLCHYAEKVGGFLTQFGYLSSSRFGNLWAFSLSGINGLFSSKQTLWNLNFILPGFCFVAEPTRVWIHIQSTPDRVLVQHIFWRRQTTLSSFISLHRNTQKTAQLTVKWVCLDQKKKQLEDPKFQTSLSCKTEFLIENASIRSDKE
jgi:hypothetical protein